jgi:hypothetical protein
VGKKKKLDVNRLMVRVLQLMVKYRPDEITFARVSRHCAVPRATLYYYFGASRVVLVNEAIRYGMARFVHLQGNASYSRFKSWEAFEARKMRRSLRLMSKYPWVAQLYFRYRTEGGLFGESIRDIEARYFALMSEAWRHFHHSPADPHGIRIATYWKIGMFYGFSAESSLWRSEAGKEARERALQGFLGLTERALSQSI